MCSRSVRACTSAVLFCPYYPLQLAMSAVRSDRSALRRPTYIYMRTGRPGLRLYFLIRDRVYVLVFGASKLFSDGALYLHVFPLPHCPLMRQTKARRAFGYFFLTRLEGGRLGGGRVGGGRCVGGRGSLRARWVGGYQAEGGR